MPTDCGRDDENEEHFFRELQIQFLVHELKDPLAIIEAGVKSLLEKEDKLGPLSPRQAKTLKRVLRGALRGRNMVNNLLEIGRSEAGKINRRRFCPAKTVYTDLLASLEAMEGEWVDQISETMTETEVLHLLQQYGIFFHVAAGVDSIEINQDEVKFSQIVANLVRNALSFRKKKLAVDLYREGETIVVEVIDDGPGIKPEDHSLIFRRYVQAETERSTARTGHGLGLAGALILARAIGGEVSVQSEVGKGATFRFKIPLKLQ